MYDNSGLEKVFNKMKNSGVDPFGYFTITAGNLRKLKWEESDIEALGGKPRTTTTFRDVAVEEPKGEQHDGFYRKSCSRTKNL